MRLFRRFSALLPATTLAGLFFHGCSFFSLPESPVDYRDFTPVPFASGSFWYTPVTNPVIDPDSDIYMQHMIDNYADRFTIAIQKGSVRVYQSDSSAPARSVPLSGSQWAGDRRIRGVKALHLPSYIRPDTATDGHLAVIDADLGVEYDFWQFRMVKGRWIASIAAIIDLDSDGVHRQQTVRASGFALTRG